MKEATQLLSNLAFAIALFPVAFAVASAQPDVPTASASADLAEPEAEDRAAGPDPWQARVSGTGSLGLRVRTGPGMTFTTAAMLAEGSRVDVLEGPLTDAEGREWYRVTARTRADVTGWAAGSFLVEVDASQAVPQAPPARGAAPTAEASAPSGRSFTARMTAYAHGTRTASGTPVRWGVVAVDPKVIPLGSRLMIEGFEDVFVAEDTGGGVRGNHVDIYFPDVASAIRFGVQYRRITVLG